MNSMQSLISGDSNLSALIENLTDIIAIVDVHGLIQYVNPACTEVLGYLPEQLLQHSFIDYVMPEDRQTARSKLEENLANPGKTLASELHFQAKDGSIRVLQSRVRYNPQDGPDQLQGLFVTSRDVTTERHLEASHQASQAQLTRSLEQTITVVAATIGARDTYTAGHQERVADLAVKIGMVLGIKDDQLQGLKLAATIHDVGKVQIPAEILSKPMQLSEVEYALVKTHAEAGYQIMKDTDLPWPIANIIRQHHEQIDGTGYPRGLMGNEILIEAKIIAVADTMEAMTNDRPYRTSPGREMALEEVKRSGTSYEKEIVDICVQLFEKENYSFPTRSASNLLISKT